MESRKIVLKKLHHKEDMGKNITNSDEQEALEALESLLDENEPELNLTDIFPPWFFENQQLPMHYSMRHPLILNPPSMEYQSDNFFVSREFVLNILTLKSNQKIENEDFETEGITKRPLKKDIGEPGTPKEASCCIRIN
ncbi:uncharacterized protein LOC143773569 [Ranitomeya variabilis]|uniref:uncharacterized protein LOC143773569 n=1 Tax=Ranitomeya variabilis TaxID=490064 RepID=UPI004056F778